MTHTSENRHYGVAQHGIGFSYTMSYDPMRILLRVILAIVVVYAALLSGAAIAMRQPPDTFGAIMAKMPPIAFMVLPFERLWMSARAGRLHLGDPAPDFTLQTPDRGPATQLSSFRGQRPVVLVFGSYT